MEIFVKDKEAPFLTWLRAWLQSLDLSVAFEGANHIVGFEYWPPEQTGVNDWRWFPIIGIVGYKEDDVGTDRFDDVDLGHIEVRELGENRLQVLLEALEPEAELIIRSIALEIGRVWQVEALSEGEGLAENLLPARPSALPRPTAQATAASAIEGPGKPMILLQWKKVWRLIRPLVEEGKKAGYISDWMAIHNPGLPHSKSTLSKIMRMGQAGGFGDS